MDGTTQTGSSGTESGGVASSQTQSTASTSQDSHATAPGSHESKETPGTGKQTSASQTVERVPSPPKYVDIKVNGKMIRMTEKEAHDHASMAYAANDRFIEAKKIKGEVDKIISRAKENPIEALMDPALGLSKEQVRDAFEKWYHQEFIEPESLSEDQRNLRSAEQKLKKYEEAEKQKKIQEQQEEEKKLTDQQRAYLSNQIIETLESSGLPKEKFFASRIAFYMRQAHMNGWEAPQDMIVKQVTNECTSVIKSIASGATGEQLVKIFGEEIVNKIRQHDLKQLREKRQLPPASVGNNRAGTGPITERLYSSDVAKRLRDLRLGK